MPAGSDSPKPPISERLRNAFLKADAARDSPPPGVAAGTPDTLPELEDLVKRANDKERLVGVLGAPISAAIAALIVNVLISNDPAQYLSNGQPNHAHVSISLYHELLIVLFALSLLMMLFGLLRKRLALGIVMALYGLTFLNLHYWGFCIPYVMAGAWLLVRSYRLQRSLREANGTTPSRYGSSSPGLSRPKSNKRYTPPGTR